MGKTMTITIKQRRNFKKAKKKAKKAVNNALEAAYVVFDKARSNTDPVESAAITCEFLASAGFSKQLNDYLDKLGIDMIGKAKEYLLQVKDSIENGDKKELAKQVPFINLDDTAKAINETLIAISDYLDKQ